MVANEVKALASQTNKATEDIRKRVNSMQAATKKSINQINNINNIMKKVNNIVLTIATSVEEQSSTTKEIAQNINRVADGTNEMNNAVKEAAIAVDEVTKSITKSASLTNDVTQAINEVSVDSDKMQNDSGVLYARTMEVSSRSDDLQSLMKIFKLPKNVKIDKKQKKLFKFSNSFSVNVDDMDNEHKGIFNYINQIHKAIVENDSNQKILNILKDLDDWTINHFDHEEKLMQSINYDGLALQKKLHTELLNKLKENINKLESGEEIDLIKLMVFLKNWLVNHIMGIDKKYSTPMNENGIS